MEIEDLMAGDYVYNDKKQICKVCSINAIGIPYAEADNLAIDDGCFTLLYDYSGIPLTAEILEKNGFEYMCDEYGCWLLGKIELREREPYNDLFEVEINIAKETIYIHYVHELQHALRLCEIKKEIVL